MRTCLDQLHVHWVIELDILKGYGIFLFPFGHCGSKLQAGVV
jgi:hypothetical protein